MTMTLKTNIIYLWRHQDTPYKSRNMLNDSKILLSENCFLEICIFLSLEQTGPKHPEDPSNNFLNVLNMGKHEMDFLDCLKSGQHLSKSMEWKLGNMGSISSQKIKISEMLKL